MEIQTKRYALISSPDGYPARFFIYDTKCDTFTRYGAVEVTDMSTNVAWLLLKFPNLEKKIGLAVRFADYPDDLIASLGLSQFFIQFKDDSSLYAVHTYNQKTHIAEVEFAGSLLEINLTKELINSVWIKEPYPYFNGETIDNMEIMTKLMMFDYQIERADNPIGFNDWTQAKEPWNTLIKK